MQVRLVIARATGAFVVSLMLLMQSSVEQSLESWKAISSWVVPSICMPSILYESTRNLLDCKQPNVAICPSKVVDDILQKTS